MDHTPITCSSKTAPFRSSAFAQRPRCIGYGAGRVFDHVHFGVDLAWDTFICLGTFLFGLAMLRRSGFGLVFGGLGIGIAVALHAVNFATFPEPPSEAAIDLGPLIGLWYAVVSVLLLRPTVLEPARVELLG